MLSATPADRHRPACRPRLFPLPILGNCTAPLGERRDGLAPGLPGDPPALYPRRRSLTRRHSQIERIPPSLAFFGGKLGLVSVNGRNRLSGAPVQGNPPDVEPLVRPL